MTISIEDYRKKNTKEVNTSDGSVFLIKSPEIHKLSNHIETLKEFTTKTDKDIASKKELLEKWDSLVKDLLPSTVVTPVVGLESTDTQLSVSEIKFSDQLILIVQGLSLSGISPKDIKEIEDFQKHQ